MSVSLVTSVQIVALKNPSFFQDMYMDRRECFRTGNRLKEAR